MAVVGLLFTVSGTLQHAGTDWTMNPASQQRAFEVNLNRKRDFEQINNHKHNSKCCGRIWNNWYARKTLKLKKACIGQTFQQVSKTSEMHNAYKKLFLLSRQYKFLRPRLIFTLSTSESVIFNSFSLWCCTFLCASHLPGSTLLFHMC